MREYQADYAARVAEADAAAFELRRLIRFRAPLVVVAEAAKRSQLASARLYTAAACILSPP
jgi:hypothetical protein